MPVLKVAIAQINACLGDLEANASTIVAAAIHAFEENADVLLTPELSLCGYPPEDLLLRPDFYRNSIRTLNALADELTLHAPSMSVLVGHPEILDGNRYNSASVLRDGKIVATYRKRYLPNSEVFDEVRYFSQGNEVCVFDAAGVTCGIAICEDIWRSGVAEETARAGAEVLLVLNASPFHACKQKEREEKARERVIATGIPIVYANLVGGQDELVFDGGSFVMDGAGVVRQQMPLFKNLVQTFLLDGAAVEQGKIPSAQPQEAEVYQALVLGVRDYIQKNRFPGAIIGLSGGIDSALTLCIAVDALGADKVRAVMLQSPYTAQMSLDDSRALVTNLGVRYDEIPIASAMTVYETLLAPQFIGFSADTTEENLQARIRGTLLMALSNKTGSLVLTTGNKSEMAVGYATLYGDMAGGFAVIKDVYKTLVWKLSWYRNTLTAVIPENIITRPPSAELRPDQTDQDSLPPYEILDAIVQGYMELEQSPRELIAAGLPEDSVRKVIRLLKIAEYKRRQSPPGIRVTKRAFGKDWRYPITNRYSDEY
jgi:NAD+ synthetase